MKPKSSFTVLLLLFGATFLLLPSQAVELNAGATVTTGPPCNTQLGRVTVDEIQAVAATWVGILSTQQQQQQAGGEPWTEIQQAQAAAVFLGDAQYNLQVHKVCGTCAEILDEYLYNNDDHDAFSNASWQEYCAEGVYGADAVHSALVFIPEDEDGTPLGGVRNTFVNFQATRMQIDWASSTHFPQSMLEGESILMRIGATVGVGDVTEFFTSFSDTYPAMVAASSGMVALAPDFIGYGESAKTHDRSYLPAMPIKQAAVVSFYAANTYIESLLTSGCTRLSSKVVTQGYSLGGATVIYGSLALQDTGLEIARMFSQAGGYLNTLPLMEIARVLAGGEFTEFAIAFYAFAAASFSVEQPFLINTGTGQTWLSEASLDPSNPETYVPGYFFGGNIFSADEIRAKFPRSGPAFAGTVNPALIDPVVNAAMAGSVVCQGEFITPDIQFFCAALLNNSPVAFLDQVVDSNIPVEWCHAADDETIPRQVSETFLVPFFQGSDNLEEYEPLYDFLEPQGGHGFGQAYCGMAIPTWLSSSSNPEAASLLEQVPPIRKDKNGKFCPAFAPPGNSGFRPLKPPGGLRKDKKKMKKNSSSMKMSMKMSSKSRR